MTSDERSLSAEEERLAGAGWGNSFSADVELQISDLLRYRFDVLVSPLHRTLILSDLVCSCGIGMMFCISSVIGLGLY